MLNGLRNISGVALTLTVALFLTTGLASPSSAQTPVPRPESALLQFDHDGQNTESYRLEVDGGTSSPISPVQVGPAAQAGWFVYQFPFPALTPGRHGLRVFACNLSGCAGSEPVLEVVVIVRPVAPTNLRIHYPVVSSGE